MELQHNRVFGTIIATTTMSLPFDEEVGEASGIYTFEDDESLTRVSSKTKYQKSGTTACSDLYTTNGQKSLVSVVSTTSETHSNPKNEVSAEQSRVDTDLPISSASLFDDTESSPPGTLSVDMMRDTDTMVSSLESELSFMPWLKNSPFLLDSVGKPRSFQTKSDLVETIGEADLAHETSERDLERQADEVTNVFGGAYEFISQRLEARGKDIPIQTYKRSIQKTDSTETTKVNNVSSKVQENAIRDQESVASVGVEVELSVVSKIAAAHNDTDGKSQTSDESGKSPLSIVEITLKEGKHDDFAESLIHSRGFRGIVLGLTVLILCAIMLAIGGALIIKKDSSSSEQAAPGQGVAGSSLVDPSDSPYLDLVDNSGAASATQEPPTLTQDDGTDIFDNDTTGGESPVNNSTPSCLDDPHFFVTIGRTERNCKWLSKQKEQEIDMFCTADGSLTGFRTACVLTCGNCTHVEV